MSVKAQWGATVEIDESVDPFADDEATLGTVIDLTGNEASLDARLAATLQVESQLYDQGVTCAVKQDHVGTSCFACPLYQGDDYASPHGTLCRVGREQQTILTSLAIRQHGGGRQ